MEEYLLSQLDTPVVLKDGTMMTKPDGSPMTKQEAIATNILNDEGRREGCPVHPEHSDAGQDHEEKINPNNMMDLSVPDKREAADSELCSPVE